MTTEKKFSSESRSLSLLSFTHTYTDEIKFRTTLTRDFMNVATGLGWGKLDLHCSNLPSGSWQKNYHRYQHLRSELSARVCRVALTRLPTLQPSAGPSSPAEPLQLLQPPVLHPLAMGCGSRHMLGCRRTFQCLHNRVPGPHLAEDCALLTGEEKGRRKRKKKRRWKKER